MILLLTTGEFGHRVAGRLTAAWSDADRLDLTSAGDPAFWPPADLLVLAAEHASTAQLDTVDRAAFAWRRPWFPVLLDEPYLRCGPAAVPGRSACHRCFSRRRRQHAQAADAWDDPVSPALPGTAQRVSGFADHHVDIAVGLAQQARRDCEAGSAAGYVRTVRLVDGTPSRAAVIAVDGCSRCRSPRDPDRDLRELVAAISGTDEGA